VSDTAPAWGDLRSRSGLVALALLLPGFGLAYWHGTVAAEMRTYGRRRGDSRLSATSPPAAVVTALVGWLLVLPAAVQTVRTAHRVQRCESLCLGAARPVAGLLWLLAAALVAGLLGALDGAPVAIPLGVLLANGGAVAVLQPRLNACWLAARDLPPEPSAARPESPSTRVPLLPPWLDAPVREVSRNVEWGDVATILFYVTLFGGGAGAVALTAWLGRSLAAVDRSGLTAGALTGLLLVGLGVGTSLLLGWSLRELENGRARPRRAIRGSQTDPPLTAVALLSCVSAVAWVWSVRPLFHGLLMPLYQWPLVTWIPLVLGVLFIALCALASAASRRGLRPGLRAGITYRVPVTIALWLVLMALLPSWQGRALYEASVYTAGRLPRATEPRLLPKAAAETFASNASLHDAHLVVEPSSNDLVWSGEHEADSLTSTRSDSVYAQPLDRVDGTMQPVAAGFTPPTSRVGPGSLQWRAYDRHWLTRVQDAVLVPLGGSRAVAVAPYLRYRGFPVRHPYWAGVYVYHQDGRLEDLTPHQALSRPELAGSGRLFPEQLARATAEAYGYRTGAGALLTDEARTVVSDAPGNPQPYLTNLGDRQERWVTIAHPARNPATISAVFLTDSASGATEVWRPRRGTRLLSNAGAIRLVKALPLDWTGCCDDNGNDYWARKAVEPTPVFARGRLYYLVSVMPNPQYVATTQPVDETVVVDAQEAVVAGEYSHSDSAADTALRKFFTDASAPSR
jgi:hypothetical protein